jgi:hypothetical protein
MSKVDAIRSKIFDNEAELAVSAHAGDDNLGSVYRYCVTVWAILCLLIRSARTSFILIR